MFHLDLTEEERQTLLYLLDDCIADLKHEIHDTDRAEYREMLKHRRDVLQKLWLTLQPTPETRQTA